MIFISWVFCWNFLKKGENFFLLFIFLLVFLKKDFYLLSFDGFYLWGGIINGIFYVFCFFGCMLNFFILNFYGIKLLWFYIFVINLYYIYLWVIGNCFIL